MGNMVKTCGVCGNELEDDRSGKCPHCGRSFCNEHLWSANHDCQGFAEGSDETPGGGDPSSEVLYPYSLGVNPKAFFLTNRRLIFAKTFFPGLLWGSFLAIWAIIVLITMIVFFLSLLRANMTCLIPFLMVMLVNMFMIRIPDEISRRKILELIKLTPDQLMEYHKGNISMDYGRIKSVRVDKDSKRWTFTLMINDQKLKYQVKEHPEEVLKILQDHLPPESISIIEW